MRLLLLRHGATASSGVAPAGQRDEALLPAARRAWPALRRRLTAWGPDRILCSDLQRSRLPASDLAQRLGLEAEVLPALREQDFGDWTARPWAAAAASDPFFGDPVRAAPPAGESFAACARRVRSAVLPVLDAAEAAESSILILAHAGSLRAILGSYLGLPLARCLDLAWDPWGESELRCWGRRGVLVAHNR
jgi:broad specificity phosphatase PhoE